MQAISSTLEPPTRNWNSVGILRSIGSKAPPPLRSHLPMKPLSKATLPQKGHLHLFSSSETIISSHPYQEHRRKTGGWLRLSVGSGKLYCGIAHHIYIEWATTSHPGPDLVQGTASHVLQTVSRPLPTLMQIAKQVNRLNAPQSLDERLSFRCSLALERGSRCIANFLQ